MVQWQCDFCNRQNPLCGTGGDGGRKESLGFAIRHYVLFGCFHSGEAEAFAVIRAEKMAAMQKRVAEMRCRNGLQKPCSSSCRSFGRKMAAMQKTVQSIVQKMMQNHLQTTVQTFMQLSVQ
jgi:hypothetical protein